MTGILGGLIGSTSAGPRLIGFSTGVQPTTNLPVSVSVPSGTRVGDLLVVYAQSLVGSNGWNNEAGWTEMQDLLGRLITTRIWDGGSSTYSFNSPNNSPRMAAMLSFRSSSFGRFALSASADNPVAPSIDVPANNSILLAVATNISVSGISYSAPSGWTRIVHLTSPRSLSVFIKDTPQLPGPSGTTTLTRTSGGPSSVTRAQHISISPA